MANTNAPFGFRLVGQRTNGGLEHYTVAATYATTMGEGDPVKLTGTGRNIEVAAGGVATCVGVLVGVEYTDLDGKRQWSTYWPGNVGFTDVKAMVQPAQPDDKWVVQCDSLAEGDVGALADWTLGTASVTKKRSTTYLAVSAATDTTSKGFFIERLYPDPKNAYGAYALAEGHFTESALAGNAGGV